MDYAYEDRGQLRWHTVNRERQYVGDSVPEYGTLLILSGISTHYQGKTANTLRIGPVMIGAFFMNPLLYPWPTPHSERRLPLHYHYLKPNASTQSQRPYHSTQYQAEDWRVGLL